MTQHLKELETTSIPLFFPTELINLLLKQGLSKKSILQNSGITEADLTSPEARVSMQAHSTLLQNAEKLSNHPHLGILFGASLKLNSLGLIAQAAISSSTLAEAIETIAKYLTLRSPLFYYIVSHKEDGLLFKLVVKRDLGRSNKFVIDSNLAASASFAKQITNRDLPDLIFHFTAPEPTNVSIYKENLSKNIRFNQSWNGFFIPNSTANLVLPTANQMNATEARRFCETEMNRLGTIENLQQLVKTLIRSKLTTGTSETEIATIVGYSPRNLRRHLAKFDTSFRQELQSAKIETSQYLLRSTHMTIEEIAYEVGFQNVGNFSRAFKKWTDSTPSIFRRKSLEQL